MIRYQNALLRANCLDILPRLASDSADFILTDPPYVRRYRSRDGRVIPNDKFTWLKPAFRELYRLLKPSSLAVCFYGWAHIAKFAAAFQDAGFKGDPAYPSYRIGDVIEWTEFTGNRLHPSQKPVTLLLPLIETFCPPGGLVLDPFAGSGSTLLAAEMTGRSYLGIELDASYHALAAGRLREQRLSKRAYEYMLTGATQGDHLQ